MMGWERMKNGSAPDGEDITPILRMFTTITSCMTDIPAWRSREKRYT